MFARKTGQSRATRGGVARELPTRQLSSWRWVSLPSLCWFRVPVFTGFAFQLEVGSLSSWRWVCFPVGGGFRIPPNLDSFATAIQMAGMACVVQKYICTCSVWSQCSPRSLQVSRMAVWLRVVTRCSDTPRSIADGSRNLQLCHRRPPTNGGIQIYT